MTPAPDVRPQAVPAQASPTAAPAHAPGGSLRALFRFEWAKLRGRRITWAPFGVLAGIVVLVTIVFDHLQFRHTLRLLQAFEPLTSKEQFVNGYYMAAHAMLPVFRLLLPIFIAVLAALSVAGEGEAGTLRACLVRPVSRRRLLLVKFAWLAAYAVALSLFFVAAATAAGVARFGTGNLYSLNFFFHNGDEGVSMVPQAEVPARLLLAAGLAGLGMTVLAALALLISALVETAAMACVLTLSVYFAEITLYLFPALDWLYPWLFVTHMFRWQQCFYSHVKTGDICVSLLHLAGYLVVFLTAAAMLFEERDIKS